MRSRFHAPVILCLAAAGCATATGGGGKPCHALFSLAAPAYRCEASAAPEIQPPEPDNSPVAEPDKEPEPEPVKEPVKEPEPRVVVREDNIEISERVQFKSGSADLLPESEKLLSEVADAMKAHPEILKVRVEGHTDKRAGTRFNQKLSSARARAVRKYLIEQGVKPGRLVARGYGEKQPIAKNTTQEGRYKNRRVEFKILKRRRK